MPSALIPMRSARRSPWLASLLLLAASGAGLSACDPQDGEDTGGEAVELKGAQEPDATDKTSEQAEPTVDDDAVTNAAFQAAYGKTPPVRRSNDMGRQEINPARIVRTGPAIVLISEVEINDGCHACTGALDLRYLKKADSGFVVGKSYDDAVPGSSWGKPPLNWSVKRNFVANPVIYAEGGGTWQGYTCKWGTLHELTPDGPKQIARFPLYYSNGGAVIEGDPVELDGKITNVVAGKSFDIEYSGTKTLRDHYILKDGSYKLAGKSKMETC